MAFLVGAMMITISSENSLLLWAQNRNHVNNIVQNIGDKSYDFFMKDLFLEFFNNLKNSFNNPNNIKISFCKEWQKVNNIFYCIKGHIIITINARI